MKNTIIVTDQKWLKYSEKLKISHVHPDTSKTISSNRPVEIKRLIQEFCPRKQVESNIYAAMSNLNPPGSNDFLARRLIYE